MAAGQGSTWVLVADAHGARVLEVDDAGVAPRVRATLHALKDGSAATAGGRPAEAAAHGAKSTGTHAHTGGEHRAGEAEDRRFAGELVRVLERGLEDQHFAHLVVVAPPRLLGVLREGLTRGLAERLRASTPKDWSHLPERELLEHVREMVPIWPAAEH